MDKLLNSRDLDFLLYEMLDTESLLRRERYREQSREIFDVILNTADSIACEYFASQDENVDDNEPTFDDARANPIPEAQEAWNAIAEAGFMATHQASGEGDRPLPGVVCAAVQAYFSAANISSDGHPLLSETCLEVSTKTAALAYRGYLQALGCAREQPQERLPYSPAKIIGQVHVRRRLLTLKAYAEGALALSFYAASLVEDMETADTDCEKQRAAVLQDLLTPVVKTWPSKYGCRSNDLSVRQSHIHDDAESILALELLSRKVPMQHRYSYEVFKQEMRLTLQLAKQFDSLNDVCQPLREALKRLDDVTEALLAVSQRDPDLGLANATLYLDFFGRIVMAWIWLKQAVTASRAMGSMQALVEAEENFYRGKLQAARYYFEWELPLTVQQADLLISNNRLCFDMRDAWY